MQNESDVDTFLAGEADRLRVIAAALRGLVDELSGEGLESKVLHAAAGEMEAVATDRDDFIPGAYCVRVADRATAKLVRSVENYGRLPEAAGAWLWYAAAKEHGKRQKNQCPPHEVTNAKCCLNPQTHG